MLKIVLQADVLSIFAYITMLNELSYAMLYE